MNATGFPSLKRRDKDELPQASYAPGAATEGTEHDRFPRPDMKGDETRVGRLSMPGTTKTG